MARGINKVILIGNVGTEPEVRYMSNGNPVANLSIATSESWKDKQTGERQERTEWHRGVCYNRLAEIVGEYVRKGSKVYVEGSLKTRKWQDANGADKYTTEVIINELQMLDGRSQAAPRQDAQQQQGFQQQAAPVQQQPSHTAQQQAASRPQQAAPQPQDSFDDDIPF